MIVRLIKLAISFFVWLSDYLYEMLCIFLRRKKQATCVILYYHTVYHKETESFAQQMEDLVRWTNPTCINDIGKMKPGLRYSAITIDDGFTCVLDNALPELLKRNIPATIFIPSACLGQQPTWLDEGNVDHKNAVMTEVQLNSLDKKLFLIGSHGRTHQNMLQIDPGEARKEIIQSKKELENILNKPIETISFPYGDFNQTHIDMAIQAGYRQAYSILPQLIYFGSDSFLRGRVKVDPSDWRLEYRLKLLGAYRWLPIAFLIKQRLNILLKKIIF